jgi:hypothetical protein
MQGHDHVPAPVATARDAYVPDYTDQASAFNEHAVTVPPSLLKFIVKSLVVSDGTELVGMLVVFLQNPVRW